MPRSPHRRRRHVEPRLVAEPVEARSSAPAFLQVQSDGRGLRLREGVQEPRPGGGEERSRGADDRLAGLVAGGLRPLRPVVHSHGVAQRRHLPHRRRPRRRRPGPAALRAAQQLAGQRQPRQGAPAPLADQAEVWPQDFLGRPDDPRPATSRSKRWASRRSASAAVARTPGSRIRTSIGARETTWLGGDIRYAHGSEGVEKTDSGARLRRRRGRRHPLAATWRIRSLRCRWV